MLSDHPGYSQPRLLPEALENTVRGWAIRVTGCTLVAFALTSWLGLLTWRAPTAGGWSGAGNSVRLMLGPFGTAASDFMLQTLGLAAIVALLGPLIWGLELLTGSRPVPHIHRKLMLFPFGVLLLAGAFSGLPAIAAWPLHNGYGGMLGDIIFNVSALASGVLSAERGSLLACAALAAAGAALTAHSVGFELSHFKPGPSEPGQPLEAPPPITRRPSALSMLATSAGSSLISILHTPAPRRRAYEMHEEIPIAADDRAEDIGAPFTSRAQWRHEQPEPAPEPELEPEPWTPSPFEAEDPAVRSREEDEARAFAERFAPASAAKVRKPRASAKPRKAKEKVKETARQHLLPIINATLAFAGRGGSIRRPSLDLLRRPGAVQHVAVDAATVSDTAKLLQSALADFGVEGLVRDAQPGPVVTRYEFEPARGTKTARVIGLSEDIARMLSVNAVRIGVIPGKSTLGIEVPNAVRTPVLLREILESDTYRHSDATLPLALGRGINGEAVVADLARMPHLLMAGTTGSGKSVAINSMILSLIYAKSPDQCRLLLIDPKMLELSPYNGIPHLAAPVVTNADEAATALEWAVAEMERRYQLMAKLGVRNIEAFNARARRDGGAGRALVRTVQTGFDPATGLPVFEDEQLDGQPMPYLVIVVDEFADLMIAAGERVETAVQRLSQMARAAGIHLVMATQRPTVDIVTGTIKANMPMRMSFRVASKIDSRTILNAPGAEQLLGQGDMLLSSDGSQMFRVHGTYVADEEVERVAQTLRDAGEPAYISFNPVEAAPPQQPAPTIEFAPDRPAPRIMPEAAYATAVDVVAADRKASPGHLCRRLGLDEDTAAAFIDRMEQEGLVGPPSLLGRRRIIVGAPEFGYQAVA